MKFTVYVDRDVSIEVPNDRRAGLIAARIASAVDEAIGECLDHPPAMSYARTTCHRGERNKMVFDHEVGDDG